MKIRLGKNSINKAEKISKQYNKSGIIVIAGVSTKNYYRKFGYEIPFNYKNDPINNVICATL